MFVREDNEPVTYPSIMKKELCGVSFDVLVSLFGKPERRQGEYTEFTWLVRDTETGGIADISDYEQSINAVGLDCYPDPAQLAASCSMWNLTVTKEFRVEEFRQFMREKAHEQYRIVSEEPLSPEDVTFGALSMTDVSVLKAAEVLADWLRSVHRDGATVSATLSGIPVLLIDGEVVSTLEDWIWEE